ncbi:helix-turn-helix transcriptional regulator [Tepidibacillus fermentans]|uniref:Putative DNA-binding transcriptional regulator YafY n=1 Tax=Tepidibacillus fermentans TaxID=1281767 RepID=A0A4R3KCS8_9BACI|nr:transcriptional regulator [Tepidibacillus fermentans]TCS81044.1 putative DNA-binding transcriptional regulator YafY [Tepidibacillus fermentans]
MSEKMIRLLRILNLIQSKPGILARELAERCETTERTIYRDLETLSSIAPISNMGHGKGYQFIGDFSLYPLNWDEQEALSFSMLPSIIQPVKHMLPKGFDTAYEKVMATYKKEKKQNDEILKKVTDIIQMGSPAYRQDRTNFMLPIIQAILSKKTIQTIYHTQSRNDTSEREIDPYYLVPREQRFYLVGYCHVAKDIRTFRISHFLDVRMTDQTFDMKDFNIRHYLKNTWSIERGEKKIHFKVKFSPRVARYIKEEELFVIPKLTDNPDGSLLFEVTVNHDREFLNWIYQYGPDTEILEPKEYRDKMKEMLKKWIAVYGRGV